MTAKFIFTGAVIESWHALEEFLKQGLKPALVCSIQPELSRRHSDFVDLAPLAQEHGIPMLTFDNVNEPQVVEQIRAIDPDYIVVIGWSQLLREELLSIPRKGCFGFHPSPLPKGRGRAAIPWTILNQERETGVTLLYLADGVNSGDIITQRKFPVAPDETAQSLYDKVCEQLREMIRTVAPYLREDQPLPSTPQDHAAATYLAKRGPDDGWIEWDKPAADIERLIRAVGKPYPGAFTVYKNRKLIVWQARMRETFNQIGTIGQILTINEDSVTVQCGEQWLDILLVQDNDGEIVPAQEFFRRVHVKLGINTYKLWQAFIDTQPD